MKQITLIFITLLLFQPVFAGEGKGGKKGGKGNGIFKQLDLNDDQREKIKSIRQSRKSQIESLKTQKNSSREAFQSALEAGSSDSKLKSLHKKMLDAKIAFKTYRFETMLQTRAVLNASQKKKFHELKSQMKGAFKRGKED